MITDRDGYTYLTYEEYSKRYGLSYGAVKERVHRGTIWVKKIGRRSYIWEKDVPSRRGPGRPKGSKNRKTLEKIVMPWDENGK